MQVLVLIFLLVSMPSSYSLDDLFINVALITIKSLGARAFAECRSLPYIDLRNLDCDISDNTFSGCASLQFVYMNNSANITSIGEEAFAYCTSLSYVEIGAGVNNIKNEAFSNCVNLKTLNIKSTASITFGQDVFENCHSINKIYYSSASANASEWTPQLSLVMELRIYKNMMEHLLHKHN